MANYADILAQYQTEIDSFFNALNRIDIEHGTFIKLSIEDVQPRPMCVVGEGGKPIQHSRAVMIDEIILRSDPYQPKHILFSEDLKRIERAITDYPLGSGGAAELIEAAEHAANRGRSVREMIKHISVNE